MTNEKLAKGLKMQTQLSTLNKLYDNIDELTWQIDDVLIKKLLGLVQEEINKLDKEFKEL